MDWPMPAHRTASNLDPAAPAAPSAGFAVASPPSKSPAPMPDRGEVVVARGAGVGMPALRGNPAGGAIKPALRTVERAGERAIAPAPSSSPSLLSAPLPSRMAMHWNIDPRLTFLNHGSYGAVPKTALRAQAEYRERMERDPVRLFKSELENLMDGAREKIAAFINANPADLAFVRNATHALCTILYALPLKAGDEVLVTDHEYGSLFNELERMAREIGIVVVKAKIPFPITGPQAVVDRVIGAMTPRTRLVVISHIASTSSLVLPVGAIIRECNDRGIDVVLDGAHSPGQIPVDVRALAPTFFIGSGHKWLSGPKGSAFMTVRPDRQGLFRPLALSARANKVRPERALFLRDFDYQGTDDYSAIVTLPSAVEAMGNLLPGGWPALMRANHELVLRGRRVVCDALGIEPCCPDAMVGSMVSLRIPEPPAHLRSRPTRYDDALQDILLEKYRIVVPIWRLMCSDERIVRISAQAYNTIEQYEYLAGALKAELAAEWR